MTPTERRHRELRRVKQLLRETTREWRARETGDRVAEVDAQTSVQDVKHAIAVMNADGRVVPAHFDDEGHWCSRGGMVTVTGHCDAGCDHAAHYSNDGHPECDDAPVIEHAGGAA